MESNSESHKRRLLRLKEYDYSLPGAYFITLITKNREHLFGEIQNGQMVLNEYGKIVHEEYIKLSEIPIIELDVFQIMPDHIHGVIIIRENDLNPAQEIKKPIQAWIIHKLQHNLNIQKYRRNMILPKIIGRFKTLSSKRINQLRQTRGFPVWQRNYYERVVRNEIELKRIREYIINNPINWEIEKLIKFEF
ncbi:transposase [Sulfurihydrogenibium sp.]|jgi:REP element-mobilizing transposase RayT|uniref:transposase n=1 Tax=Sulfurihydrogenibium sp. TaxID=2053621 RepID=UPI00261F3E81|nr:transposase [Sulfurihydrogenibium sp.]